MEFLPGWVISPIPGPPPRQHKHERQYTPSTHPFIPTRRIWNDDYGGQMIFGDLVGLKFPDICLTGEENPEKNLSQETCPDRGSNPRPMRDKRACYHLLHSGGLYIYIYITYLCIYICAYIYIYIYIYIIISVFCPRVGLSRKLRHQGCSSAQRQVFHCKLRNQGYNFTRDE